MSFDLGTHGQNVRPTDGGKTFIWQPRLSPENIHLDARFCIILLAIFLAKDLRIILPNLSLQ